MKSNFCQTFRIMNNVNRVGIGVHCYADHKKRSKIKHNDCLVNRMKTNKETIKGIISCLIDFKFDTFDQTNQTLQSLQSAILAYKVLCADLKYAKTDSKKKVKELE